MYINHDLLKEIKSRLDLRDIIEQELGQGKRSGQSRRWCCPFHEGNNPTAFSVTKTYFYCWSCEEKGDLFAWFMKRHGLEFKTAVKQAALEAGLPVDSGSLRPSPVTKKPRPIRPAVTRPLAPPDPDWQQAQHHYVMRCQAYLWNAANQPALDYLLQSRGLTEKTVKEARLGYDPGRNIIVIPWYINDELWRVGGRSLVKNDRKAPVFPGFKQGLYNAGRLSPDKPAVLLEGELDALCLAQEAGDLVTPVATGGITGARQVRWVAQLSQLPLTLVAFDCDNEGERAVAWWLAVLPGARRWRPIGAKDPNDMLVKAGMSLRHWLAPALGLEVEPQAEPSEGELERPGWRRWLKG